MAFFVVTGTGSCALMVKVVRAETAAEAVSLAASQSNLDLFPTLRVQELPPEGEAATVYEASYVE